MNTTHHTETTMTTNTTKERMIAAGYVSAVEGAPLDACPHDSSDKADSEFLKAQWGRQGWHDATANFAREAKRNTCF